MRFIYRILAALALACPLSAWSLGQYHQAPEKKLNQYLSEGVVIGGQAGDAVALREVRRQHSSQSGVERVIFDIGDLKGEPLPRSLSYFNASLRKHPGQLSIDFAQMQRSGVDQAQIAKIFSASPYVKKVELTYDPEDLSTNVRMDVKDGVEMEIYRMPAEKDKGPRLVLDLRQTPRKVK